jgi:hypothetical protein
MQQNLRRSLRSLREAGKASGAEGDIPRKCPCHKSELFEVTRYVLGKPMLDYQEIIFAAQCVPGHARARRNVVCHRHYRVCDSLRFAKGRVKHLESQAVGSAAAMVIDDCE